MKIEIKCRFSGIVLFAHEQDGNTLKITVEAAVKARANLARAYLVGANLAGAYLVGAYLVGEEKLKGKRPVFQIGPIGSRCAYLVAYITDRGLRIRAGCFFGSVSKFKEMLKNTHGDNEHAQEYKAALTLINKHAKIWGES